MKKSDFDLIYQNQSVESKIVASLERISQAFRVLLWHESKEHSLTPIQVQVLIFLLFHDSEKCKVSYLADEFNMTKATISDTVKTLENKNLISKVYEPNDLRSYVIKLTKKGEEIAYQTSLFSNEIFKPIEELRQDDKEMMLLNLLTIIRHLNKSGIITIQRMCMTCKYYKTPNNEHFCELLNQKLHVSELRVDCPEHAL